MQSARLKLHYHYLTNFDFTDKELQIKENLVAVPNLNTLVVRSKPDQPNSETCNIPKTLVLELFGNQKTLMAKADKIFSKKLLFKVTLRKENLFLFLDSCLNTIFLHQHKVWVWNNVQAGNKLHFYLSNSLINNFSITPTQLRYSFQLPDLFMLLNKTSKDRSFYLIPTNKVKD